MGRPYGFLWTWPGFYSVVVPYHDTNDFYFSGHVGTCVLMILEYKASKHFKMMLFMIFICANQWLLMTFVRTHYIIDLVAGFIFAHYCHIAAEWLSYWPDVKIVGAPANTRRALHYKPCPCCGWSNRNASHYMDCSEKLKMKEMALENNSLLDKSPLHLHDSDDDEVYVDRKFEKSSS